MRIIGRVDTLGWLNGTHASGRIHPFKDMHAGDAREKDREKDRKARAVVCGPVNLVNAMNVHVCRPPLANCFTQSGRMKMGAHRCGKQKAAEVSVLGGGETEIRPVWYIRGNTVVTHGRRVPITFSNND